MFYRQQQEKAIVEKAQLGNPSLQSNQKPSSPSNFQIIQSNPSSSSQKPSQVVSKGKINYFKDTEANEQMKKAYEYCKTHTEADLLPNGKNASVRNVANYFQVPKSSLHDRLKNKVSIDQPPKPGRPPTFSEEDLRNIVNHLLSMAEIGYGYSQIQTISLLRYLSLQHKDKRDFKGGYKFLSRLFIQFPELSLRKASIYDFDRAKFLTPEAINNFFQVLKTSYRLSEELSEKKLDPKNIWSLDEVGFRLNALDKTFIISRKGNENAHLISSQESSHVTVIFCTNARGYTQQTTLKSRI